VPQCGADDAAAAVEAAHRAFTRGAWASLAATARGKPAVVARDDDRAAEVRRLKRGTEERDIHKSGRVLRQGCKVKYAFKRSIGPGARKPPCGDDFGPARAAVSPPRARRPERQHFAIG
jgi:hypothetical protein